MPQSEALLAHATTSLNNLFDAGLPAKPTSLEYEQLHQLLKRRIMEMMQHEHQRLLNLFYRIDLDENKVAAAFTLPTMADVASKLAELVIERELLKVQLRLKYSKKR